MKLQSILPSLLISVTVGHFGWAQDIDDPFLACTFGDTKFQLAESGDGHFWISGNIQTTARIHTGNAFGAVTAYALGPDSGPQILVVYTGEFSEPEIAPQPGTAVLITVSPNDTESLEVNTEDGQCEELD